MSDEADNVVLRGLRELRAHIDERFDLMATKAEMKTRLDDVDEHLVKVDGRLTDLTTVTHKIFAMVTALATGVADLDERLKAIEAPKH